MNTHCDTTKTRIASLWGAMLRLQGSPASTPFHPVHFSSETDEWATPQSFFDALHAEFNFTLDPCATALSAKCSRYFTRAQDGLAQDWGAEIVFCNPPYGRDIIKWAKKAWLSSQRGATVVLLVHARTDTRWFHEFVYGKAELRFVRGRLKFGDGLQSAPFPSLVAVYRCKQKGPQEKRGPL